MLYKKYQECIQFLSRLNNKKSRNPHKELLAGAYDVRLKQKPGESPAARQGPRPPTLQKS